MRVAFAFPILGERIIWYRVHYGFYTFATSYLFARYCQCECLIFYKQLWHFVELHTKWNIDLSHKVLFLVKDSLVCDNLFIAPPFRLRAYTFRMGICVAKTQQPHNDSIFKLRCARFLLTQRTCAHRWSVRAKPLVPSLSSKLPEWSHVLPEACAFPHS